MSNHQLAIGLSLGLRDLAQSRLLAHDEYVCATGYGTSYFAPESLHHAFNFVFAEVQSASSANFWKSACSELPGKTHNKRTQK